MVTRCSCSATAFVPARVFALQSSVSLISCRSTVDNTWLLPLLLSVFNNRLTTVACLARSAKLPTGLYILLALISLFFSLLTIAWIKIISGSTGPFFAIFAPNDRHLFVDYRSGLLFLIHQGTLPWQPIKVKKSAFFTDQSNLLHCLNLLYRFGRHISGDDFPNIRLATSTVAKCFQQQIDNCCLFSPLG